MNHLRAIVALPVTVAILVPALVLRFGPATTGWVLPPCADPARLVMLLSSTPLLGWFLGFVLLNLIYIPVLEEPGLERRFGEAYRAYKRNVPRWIPRLRPWTPGRE